jgi:hypothetical protein
MTVLYWYLDLSTSSWSRNKKCNSGSNKSTKVVAPQILATQHWTGHPSWCSTLILLNKAKTKITNTIKLLF